MIPSEQSFLPLVSRYLDAVWRPGTALLTGMGLVPVGPQVAIQLAPPAFPRASFRAGRLVLAFHGAAVLPPAYWSWLREHLDLPRRRALVTQEILDLAPGLPDEAAYHAQELIYLVDDPAAAATLLERCARRPLLQDWFLDLGVCLARHGGNRPQGVQWMERQSPTDAAGHVRWALAWLQAGEPERAQASLEALRERPWWMLESERGPELLAGAVEERKAVALLERASAHLHDGERSLRLARAWMLVNGDEQRAQAALGTAAENVRGWMEPLRLAHAWMTLLADRREAVEALRVAERGVVSALALAGVCRAWAVLGHAEEADRALGELGHVADSAADLVEMARLHADLHGVTPRCRELLEQAERAVRHPWQRVELGKAWQELFGDVDRSGRVMHGTQDESARRGLLN